MKPKQRSRFHLIVFSHLKRVRRDIFLASLCILGSTLMALAMPWPLKLIFDHILSDRSAPSWLLELHPVVKELLHSPGSQALLLLCGGMVGIALLKGLFTYYQLFLTSRVGYLLVYTLRGELFDHLQRLSLSFHNRSRSGELLSKLTSDSNTLKDVYADSALTFITQLLTVSGMFAIMFSVNLQLSLIVLTSFPLLFLAIYCIYGRVKKSARKQRRNEGLLASRVSEILSAVPLIQAFGMEDFERERFDMESSQSMQEAIRTARMEAAATRMVEIVSAVGMAIVVFFGCLQVFKGAMSPGDVLVFSAYIAQMYQPVRQITRLSTRFSRATASIERISEILDTEPEIKDTVDALVPKEVHGDIAFDQVSFGYASDNQILANASFHIRPGERVALVGGSGAGKSTIANLLLRLYDPQQGRVLIDGIDLRRYQRTALRQHIGVVLQDAILFGCTIRENIAYGCANASSAEIESAARQVHAHDFISALPDGYDTVLGESGCTLSGGQRQRLCLARAFIRKAPILILDEPTSAIDAESQDYIRSAMKQLHRDRSILLIAHHFHSIRDFDRILVLKDGSIFEQGNHAKLMEMKGYYYELYRLQNGLRAA